VAGGRQTAERRQAGRREVLSRGGAGAGGGVRYKEAGGGATVQRVTNTEAAGSKVSVKEVQVQHRQRRGIREVSKSIRGGVQEAGVSCR